MKLVHDFAYFKLAYKFLYKIVDTLIDGQKQNKYKSF